MGLPNPSSIVKKQTEAVSAQFDSKKQEVMVQINAQVESQINEVKGREKAQIAKIDEKIQQLRKVLSQLPDNHPQKAEIAKQLGMLQQQRKQIIAQVKFAISSIKANAMRQKEMIKTRLQKQKERAITMAVNQALSQYNMLIAAQRAKQQQAVNDELKAGNRG